MPTSCRAKIRINASVQSYVASNFLSMASTYTLWAVLQFAFSTLNITSTYFLQRVHAESAVSVHQNLNGPQYRAKWIWVIPVKSRWDQSCVIGAKSIWKNWMDSSQYEWDCMSACETARGLMMPGACPWAWGHKHKSWSCSIVSSCFFVDNLLSVYLAAEMHTGWPFLVVSWLFLEHSCWCLAQMILKPFLARDYLQLFMAVRIGCQGILSYSPGKLYSSACRQCYLQAVSKS